MAMDLRDLRNGFRHREVVEFINEEILSNGGTDFFTAYPSEPWNEVEDRLKAVLVDPLVPRTVKRACTWSALAMSVRLAARQQEVQVRQVRKLQDQMAEQEASIWALATELQQLRGEHKEMASQFRCTSETLQKMVEQREVLRRWLLQTESVAQISPRGLWPQNAESQGRATAAGAKGGLHAGSQKEVAQAGVHTGLFYLPGSPSPWAQVIQAPPPMHHSYRFPYPTPLPMAVPYLPPPPPLVVMETEAAAAAAAAAVPPQMPHGRNHTSGLWAAAGSQGMAPVYNQRSQRKTEGAVRPNLVNRSQHKRSQGHPRRQSQEQTWPPEAAGPGAEEARASQM